MIRAMEGFGWLPDSSGATSIMSLLAHNGCYNPFNNADPQWRTTPGALGRNALWQQQNNFCPHSIWTVFLPENPVTITEGRIGMRVWRDYATGGNPCFCVYDAVNTAPQLTVEFGSMGIVRLWRGEAGSGTLLAGTPPGTFYNDTSFMAELGYKIDGSTGYALVKINAGVPTHLDGIVINLTNVNTQNTSRNVCDSWGLGRRDEGSGVSIANYTFESVYFLDRTGAQNTDYLGNIRIQTMFTAGPGAVTGLSIGGATPAPTNWQSVQDWWTDEQQYVFAPYVGGVGLYDLYTMVPLVNQGQIFAVQGRSAMRQDDATELEGGNVLKSSTTTVYGTPRLMSESYQYVKDIWETDPATGVGWLYSGVNAVQFGPQRVA